MANKTKKNPAAVALWWLGGLKGGPALTGGIDAGKFLRRGEMTVFVFPATRFEIR